MILSLVDQYQTSLDTLFQALADPTRRAVIGRLGRGSASVGELAAPFDMALPSFTQHLKVLEETGLVRSEKTGRLRVYWLEPEPLRRAEDWMAEQRALWERRLNRFDDYVLRLKENDS